MPQTDDPMRGRARRVPLYVFASVAAVLAALFVVFVLRRPVEKELIQTPPAASADPFIQAMNAGKNYLDQGEATKAIEAFAQAVKASPAHPDALLNLANAHLRAGESQEAIPLAEQVLQLDYRSAAAHYVIGCAQLRLGNHEAAVKSLQIAHDLEPGVAAASFQLGRAQLALNQLDEAIFSFQETTIHDAKHPSAYYQLSQALVRADRKDEAAVALQTHQKLTANQPASFGNTPELLEQCKHTQARAPFVQEQPDPKGVPVTLADATKQFLGEAGAVQGPVALIDVAYDDFQDLLVRQGDEFVLLRNQKGVFKKDTNPDQAPLKVAGEFSQLLVGDLQNDRVEDVLAIGPQGARVFRFATNGVITETTSQSGLTTAKPAIGLLADLDVTGKLDFLAIAPDGTSASYFRNQGNSTYADMTAFSSLPKDLGQVRQVLADDWNNDDLLDLIFVRASQPPLLLTKQRGGVWTATNSPSDWPVGEMAAVGDVNNDLRSDLVVTTGEVLTLVMGGITNRVTLPLNGLKPAVLQLLDYDNDGWLDIVAGGNGLRVWRNRGTAGFEDRTAALGLDKVSFSGLRAIHVADFDMDCDTDLLLDAGEGGLRVLRNDGGNAHRQLKLRVIGQRSNASGLGIRIEISAGGLRLARTVSRLPIEIGVGGREKIESLNVRWFDLAINTSDVKVDCGRSLYVSELQLPTGSCPYLYACDGDETRFVTDLLGAAPLGLPVAEGKLIDADPDEYVWIGNETSFRPRAGSYTLQVTEELREVLYLDEAKLVIADHPRGTEVHPTSKLVPGKPFPAHQLVVLEPLQPLLKALHHDGSDVTEKLLATDRNYVSPLKLRAPQLRGLAEPFGVTLDFGNLPVEQPLVLVLNGWLRFGGGMANIGASHDPTLPFPFPTLEVETSAGWQRVDVTVGAPAGKTKTIIADLTGKLPPGSRRLRLTTAFEIHWDRIALMRRPDKAAAITVLDADMADLHWRGFSEFKDLPWHEPLTPDYHRLRSEAAWRITPGGWCTRYGDVRELIGRKDNALALLNGGDELTLKFHASRAPAKPAGSERNFFFFSVGWDKDADYHVRTGWTVEPLPFHGMNDQHYGSEAYPLKTNAWWIQKYNTRWVGPRPISRNSP
jgi:tetratricopeptide (TPR) repeat protein